MVEPIGDEDRARTMLYVKIGLAALVGISAGLITLQGDPSLEVIVGAVLVGTVLGAALAWYLVPDAESVSPGSHYRYRK